MREQDHELLASALEAASTIAKHAARLARAQKAPKRQVAGLRKCGEELVSIGALLSRSAGEVDGTFTDLGPLARDLSRQRAGGIYDPR
ncbi:hypothetical protein [Amycolatopsis sp. NPDC051071]|uniref:hypothetical protein n=1 Tax=Amycolatopsis sp. NPDC051071 TaxID=3154637 RepID=UPI0034308A23